MVKRELIAHAQETKVLVERAALVDAAQVMKPGVERNALAEETVQAAAGPIVLFNHADLEALARQEQRRRQPAHARADHEHVEVTLGQRRGGLEDLPLQPMMPPGSPA